MKKSYIWIVVGLFVIAFVYLTITNRNDSDSNQVANSNQTENTNEQTEMESSSTPTSLKELMSGSSSVRCEFSSTEDESISSGVVYAANGKARVDFSSTIENQTTAGHMIMDDSMAYTWMEGESKGFKISTKATASAQPNQANEKQFDPEKKLDYSCQDWGVDNSIFDIPSSVEFTDLSAMMPAVQGGSEGSINSSGDLKAAQCAACDQAPEESRAQCRAALGC